jgi:WD40 repeat protein
MIHPNGWIWSAAFSPDGALLGLGMGNAAGIVDVASGLMIRVMAGHAGTVGRVAFSPKGALLAAASDDGTARIWAPATGATRAVLPGHNYRYGAAQT